MFWSEGWLLFLCWGYFFFFVVLLVFFPVINRLYQEKIELKRTIKLGCSLISPTYLLAL